MTFVFALLVGGAFGFTLDHIGASDPGEIVRTLRLTQLRLLKTVLLATGVGAVLTFAGVLAGFVDPGHLAVRPAHLGIVVGGLLLGAGLGAAGYCPGTGLAAAATGRIDACCFVVGGLLGAAGYMLTHAVWSDAGLLAPIAGGSAAPAPAAGTPASSLIDAVSGGWLGIAVGVLAIAAAIAIPETARPTPAVRPSARPPDRR